MENSYTFPLCIQLTVPDDLFNDTEFRTTLQTLQKHRFYGVELNLTDFQSRRPQELQNFLAEFGLKLTMVATGVYANRNGLSLSSADETLRRKSVQELRKIIDFAAQAEAGVICGYIKGGPNEDRSRAVAQMKKSLQELAEAGSLEAGNLYLEATNHYEATVVNTLAEGAEFASSVDNRIQILPDTYHMNIEESSMPAAINAHQRFFRNFHISDNNRYFPGFGSIDFFSVLSLLKSINYDGTISVEGRCRKDLTEDIAATAEYIRNTSSRLALSVNP